MLFYFSKMYLVWMSNIRKLNYKYEVTHGLKYFYLKKYGLKIKRVTMNESYIHVEPGTKYKYKIKCKVCGIKFWKDVFDKHKLNCNSTKIEFGLRKFFRKHDF